MTLLPMPNPAMNSLERALWYIDRLIEAGVPLEIIQGADVRELAAMYRATYQPIVQLQVAELTRVLRETAAA